MRIRNEIFEIKKSQKFKYNSKKCEKIAKNRDKIAKTGGLNMAKAVSENDKSIVHVGIKSATEYTDTIEIPEKGTYYQLFTSTGEHDVSKCIVTMEIPKLNDIPFGSDNYYHYLGAGIISVTQVYDGTLAIRFFVSDSSTESTQFPLDVGVKFKVVEFYG